MRVTIVPAQITTVEDKVFGNLNVPQLILLTIPVALSGAIFALLPARMSLSLYKLPIILLGFLIFSLLALRFRGKILLDWLIVILRYNLRPRYFIYDKNTPYLRTEYQKPEVIQKPAEGVVSNKAKAKVKSKSLNIKVSSIAQLLAKEKSLLKSKASFIFKSNKQGGTYVVVE